MENRFERVTPEAAGLNPEALARLSEAIQGSIDQGVHYGAEVIIARDGKIGFQASLGNADREGRRPIRSSDRFCLMSLTKSFTASALLMLIERGLLTLDTPVAEILPEFGVRGKQRVTIFHLLTHMGGAWSSFLPPSPLTYQDLRDHAKTVAVYCAQPLVHRPNETVVYSPLAGYGILGEVIARVSGKRYGEFLRTELFEPLGMASSSSGLAVDHPDRVPLSVVDQTPGAAEAMVLESLNFITERDDMPGAGAYATAEDVLVYAEMLRLGGTWRDRRLLSRATVDYASQNHTGDRPNKFWDFSREVRGVADFPANFSLLGGYVRGHGHYLSPFGHFASPSAFGSIGGGTTMFMIDPARSFTLIFLSAGLLEGLGHFQRLQRVSDLALSAAI